ncbi:FG-GAP-like repeat-containing protein [Streptomyces sp. NRRL S-378]|uniref:FG-GAP-like repeat-containing protein n=1 Tax=Streptomyces sp. NRRL S-378 TaxID=1463904 RepID=UPI0007C49732|nr:FG-GAP-like repeat-containing protein [Streptomyces sp. NRRL S-378]
MPMIITTRSLIALSVVVAATSSIALPAVSAHAAERVAAAPAVTALAAESTVGGSITREEIIERAKYWLGKSIPYNQGGSYPDSDGRNYRTDCSGYVSMAWHLPTSLSTHGLGSSSDVYEIPRSDLKAGDILNSYYDHVILFDKWDDAAHTKFSYYSFGSTPVKHVTGVSINAATFDSHPNGDYKALRYKRVLDTASPVFTQTTAADFNGDGEADIIARDGSATLKMWTHNAGGYFNAPVNVTGGWNFTQTAAADFTGDGKADLIARDSDGTLMMWTGRGTGTFNAPVNVTNGWNFTQTAAADFDGNGKTDLIARDADGNLKIWAGRGDGTFAAAAHLSAGWNFTQTVAADFNGDKQADIIAKNADGDLKLWTHNAGGYFNAPVDVTGGWNFSQTTAADFDGNGNSDLIARNDNNGDLTIWAGHGNGTFGTPAKLTGGW